MTLGRKPRIGSLSSIGVAAAVVLAGCEEPVPSGLELAERSVETAKTTIDLLALAFFDDAERGIDVMPHLDRKLGAASANLVRALKHHVHEPYTGATLPLVEDTRALVGRLQRELA